MDEMRDKTAEWEAGAQYALDKMVAALDELAKYQTLAPTLHAYLTDQAANILASLHKQSAAITGEQQDFCGADDRGPCCICIREPGHSGMHKCGSEGCGEQWAIPYVGLMKPHIRRT